jgi:hypothetical protein
MFLIQEKQSKAIQVWNHWDVMYVRGWFDERTLTEHDPLWKPSTWNMFNRTLNGKRRTTNSVESCHRRLSALIKRHMRFEEFVEELKHEWTFIGKCFNTFISFTMFHFIFVFLF